MKKYYFQVNTLTLMISKLNLMSNMSYNNIRLGDITIKDRFENTICGFVAATDKSTATELIRQHLEINDYAKETSE